MTLQSMTGFSRSQGHYENTSWVWELCSVNGKGLDIRSRIPSGFEVVEAAARKSLPKHFSRGNIQVSLTVSQTSGNALPVLNQEAVYALLEAATQLQAKTGGDLPTAAELMAMRGVIEVSDQELDKQTKETLDTKILESLDEAAKALVGMREQEGAEIAAVLSGQVDHINTLYHSIDMDASRTPQAIKQQLKHQVHKLVEVNEQLDEDRLYQEVALLAAKADLQEELDRLSVHVKAAKELLASNGPVGRKLDFMAQEFNRECNTICSKSNSAVVTSLGLDMKLIIDQFREQIQNME